MELYFIRHGHPDYKNDCLTPLGHLQAKACAERLADEGINEIYSSTCGRSLETAAYTAESLGITVSKLDFMREIRWGRRDGDSIEFNGLPWHVVNDMVAKGESVTRDDWAEIPPFDRNIVVDCVKNVQSCFDAWIESLGYRREGDYYRVLTDDVDKKVALFSHGGSSTVAMGRLLNMTFPQAIATFHHDFTSVCRLFLRGEKGILVCAKIEYLNDYRHILGLENIDVP